MAACRLAAKGRTLADASYESEVNSITAFLQLQRPAPAPAINPNALDIVPEDYVAPRFAKKFKGKVTNHSFRIQINFSGETNCIDIYFSPRSWFKGSWKHTRTLKTCLSSRRS